ncbi:MAG: acetyl-CoA carboxylase biotin carboxyl carrier protein subunit, partial [Gammaproteobacteria bacterium]|nr:acetyl-CoA carboxylase biotin carboxyl carrier protein subunit [Gammaproteobacteria bacterium]
QVRAPMPGVVIEIDVQAGDGVAENQRLALIESMKMQTEITAPSAGTVTAVHVAPGASFERGATLIELERSA